jgi:competence ComEA-like helix-hairpin-helix protein
MTFLTPAERRLAALLFGLSVLGLAARGGSRLSPEVRAWLADSTGGAPEGPAAMPPEPGPAPPTPPEVVIPVAEGNQPAGVPQARVDPNTASAGLLETLPGVGPVLAARIVEERTRNGPFARAEDLLRVKGLGAATLARVRPRLALE